MCDHVNNMKLNTHGKNLAIIEWKDSYVYIYIHGNGLSTEHFC